MSFDAVIVNWSGASELRTVVSLDETEDVEIRVEWWNDATKRWELEKGSRIKVPTQRLEDVIAAMRAVVKQP